MVKKYFLLGFLFAFTVTAFILSGVASPIADTLSDFMVNPAATANINGKAGSRGLAAVNVKGELFIEKIETPFPTVAPLELTPAPQITVLPGSIPTAFGTPQFANTAALKSITVNNQFNQDVRCAYDGSSVSQFTVPAQTQYWDNFAAKGLKMSGAVGCIPAASTPASGTLQIWGE